MNLIDKRKSILKQFGNVIKYNRLKRGFTQKQLADFIHVEVSTISRYEKGLMEIPASLLMCISEFLGFSPVEFYRNDSKYENYDTNNRVTQSKSNMKNNNVTKSNKTLDLNNKSGLYILNHNVEYVESAQSNKRLLAYYTYFLKAYSAT